MVGTASWLPMHADGERSEKDSDLKLDSEVRHNEPTCEQLAIEVGKMNDCMINQDKLIKRGAHERNELKAKLESALLEIDILSLLMLSLMFLNVMIVNCTCLAWLL
jgi:hypothetical protein